VGIVSHGLYGEEASRHGRCGDVGQMDAYASVGAFREWIDATIKAEGL
jgi:secreted trypsin-like serine protease